VKFFTKCGGGINSVNAGGPVGGGRRGKKIGRKESILGDSLIIKEKKGGSEKKEKFTKEKMERGATGCAHCRKKEWLKSKKKKEGKNGKESYLTSKKKHC